jgi:hypothetical protein
MLSGGISVLVSTTFRDPARLRPLFGDLAVQEPPVAEVVLVVQLGSGNEELRQEVCSMVEDFSDRLEVHLVLDNKLGLSRSRNIALASSSGDLLLLADDDCRYPAGLTQTIIDSCRAYNSADAWTFQVATPEGRPFKKYAPMARRHDLRTLMHVSSVEVVLSRQVLAEGSTLFDERFGLGTTLPSGEENIMLVDLLRKGFEIQYVPVPIVVHDEHQRQLTSDHLYAKGAMFRRMFGTQGGVWLAVFLAKKAIGHELADTMAASIVQGIKGYRDFRRMPEME